MVCSVPDKLRIEEAWEMVTFIVLGSKKVLKSEKRLFELLRTSKDNPCALISEQRIFFI